METKIREEFVGLLLYVNILYKVCLDIMYFNYCLWKEINNNN